MELLIVIRALQGHGSSLNLISILMTAASVQQGNNSLMAITEVGAVRAHRVKPGSKTRILVLAVSLVSKESMVPLIVKAVRVALSGGGVLHQLQQQTQPAFCAILEQNTRQVELVV